MSGDDGSGGVSRRGFLVGSGVGLLAAGTLAVEGLVLGPDRLEVSRHVLGREDVGVEPIRLAMLADLHLDDVSDLHQRIADAVRAADPDAVLLVGDSIDDAGNLPVLAEFLALLPDTGIRVATLGNWEYWCGVDLGVLRRTYERGHTRLLVNESVAVTERAVLFGTDDGLAGTPDLGGLPEDPAVTSLLLSHSPAFRDRLGPADPRIHAVISGHTHGGQVAIGGWAPVTPPGSGDYVSGWYRADGPTLFVSRGVGTSVIPIRLGCPPELAIIDWYPEASS